jgi:hypothetical protein
VLWKTREGEWNHAHLDLSAYIELITHAFIGNRQLSLEFFLMGYPVILATS